MRRFNDYVHYIWVGDGKIPDSYVHNFLQTEKLNSTYKFKIWTDDEIESVTKYKKEFKLGTIYQKLQIGRFSIAEEFGGVVCDFDIVWKETIDYLYDWFAAPTDMIFPYRNCVHFYDRGKQTTFVDDFLFVSKPGLLGNYLEYCHAQEKLEWDPKQLYPYTPAFLTVWLLSQSNVKYLSHKQVDTNEDSLIAVHENKNTWSAN